MEELKPCPFCGGEPEIQDIVEDVLCLRCGVRLFSKEAWNTRASISHEDLQKVIDKLRGQATFLLGGAEQDQIEYFDEMFELIEELQELLKPQTKEKV